MRVTGSQQRVDERIINMSYDYSDRITKVMHLFSPLQVVSFHFCQADNSHTCLVPEFVHNMAAMLSDAPQLLAYREMLHRSRELQSTLSMRACIQDPSTALEKGIMEPLDALYRGMYWCWLVFSKIPVSQWLNVFTLVFYFVFQRGNYI